MAAVSVGSTSPVPISSAGTVNDRLVVTFLSSPRSTGTVYYGTSPSVSSTNNTGSLTPGQSITLDRQQFYFIAALDAAGKNASGLLASFSPREEESPLIPGFLVRVNSSGQVETSADHGTTWVAQGTSSVLTTKGDLLGRDSTSVVRVPTGTDGQVLTADSTQTQGLKWAAANGSVFQAVDALSPTPRSVTDWGPLINAAIVAGTRRFVFGPFDYNYSTAIAASGHSGIVFEGAAGDNWFNPGANQGYTRLTWTGTGSGVAMDVHSGESYAFRDIAFAYSSASFTGTLIDANNLGRYRWERCHFGRLAAPPQTVTASLLVNLGNGILPMFESCTFEGGLTYAQGFDGSTYTFCNTANFRNCTFQGACQHSIVNPGNSWVFDNCIFESIEDGATVLSSHIYGASGGSFPVSLTLRDCTHWDADSASIKWIRQDTSVNWSLVMENCVEHSNTQTLTLDLSGNGKITIIGGAYLSAIDLGDPSVAGSKKSTVTIFGADLERTSPLHPYGHEAVFYGGNYNFANPGGNVPLDTAITNLSLEHASSGLSSHRATYSMHSGADVNVAVFAGSGNSVSGFIQLRNSAAGTSGTGLMADVVLGVTPLLNSSFGAQPHVQLTPADFAGADCNAYASVTNTTPDRFTIGIRTGLPPVAGGGTASWYYRVNWFG